jgi:hypothetical protein
MPFEDMKKDDLMSLASEHGVEGRTSMSKDELVQALRESNITEPDTTVSGFQQGASYPHVPVTPEDFRHLLPNPNKPAENQSAPSPEQLNPHLFGPQGRIPS